MASTIKVNNIQNQCGANIANKCGTTITLGASGDTITLACGASQTGFGRTGTVDWDTTAKTASFTAVSGNGYFVNTTSGAITVTMPATPSAGDIVSISDYTGTFNTNPCTIGRNGSNINGSASDWVAAINNTSITFIYVDGTEGWRITNTSLPTETLSPFIIATGGTVTCCGDYKIHTFTGPGTFTVTNAGLPTGSTTVDYLVVAGGGSGGSGCGGSGASGGGAGAGGYRESSGAASGCYTVSPLGSGVSALPVIAQGYPITVGAGGAPTPTGSASFCGSNSIFSTITSTGGGGGGSRRPANIPEQDGKPGGSGGGGTVNSPGVGNGNTPPVSPPQGNPGGQPQGGNSAGGGGGGATAAGANATPFTPLAAIGGNGGAGATSSINGTPTTRAGGGAGGGSGDGACAASGGTGGPGGGGNGGPTGNLGTAGATNTGGGGGGGGSNPGKAGSAGGSGIVIIRYKYQ